MTETDYSIKNVIQHGAYLIDSETGEVLGLAVERTEPFRVDSREKAEWALELLFEAESEMSALERRKAVLVENIDSMKRDHERRAEWLRLRFGGELETWAKKELDGQKTRTVKTPFGRLAFRKLKARLVVHDEERALAWAKQHQPQAVKTTEKLLVSELVSSGPDFQPPGTTIEPERDKFSIDTGLKGKD